MATFSQETAQLLEAKHPRQVEGNMIPTLLQLPDVEPLTTSEDEVLTAINSFPPGSSGGPDGLRLRPAIHYPVCRTGAPERSRRTGIPDTGRAHTLYGIPDKSISYKHGFSRRGGALTCSFGGILC